MKPERVLPPAEDVRAARPYILSASLLKVILRRLASVTVLVVVDVTGLTLGLYRALALRAFVVDPKPVLWGLLWDQETSWLPFLILLLVLVFWRAGLYAPRELREGVGSVFPNVVLVARSVARVRDRHRAALHDLRPVRRRGDLQSRALIGLFRALLRGHHRVDPRATGVRRKVAARGRRGGSRASPRRARRDARRDRLRLRRPSANPARRRARSCRICRSTS